ncbi:MAG: hypothetical protein ACRDQ1_08110, partial [Sciscionella sp.]
NRRVLTLGVAVTVAIGTAGCGSGATSGKSGTVPVVTGEQVLTTCVHDYFDNGILTKASAKANCESCVVDKLAKLGVRPAAGETVIDMLTGDRLSSSDVQTLQNACTEADANAQ